MRPWESIEKTVKGDLKGKPRLNAEKKPEINQIDFSPTVWLKVHKVIYFNCNNKEVDSFIAC